MKGLGCSGLARAGGESVCRGSPVYSIRAMVASRVRSSEFRPVLSSTAACPLACMSKRQKRVRTSANESPLPDLQYMSLKFESNSGVTYVPVIREAMVLERCLRYYPSFRIWPRGSSGACTVLCLLLWCLALCAPEPADPDGSCFVRAIPMSEEKHYGVQFMLFGPSRGGRRMGA